MIRRILTWPEDKNELHQVSAMVTPLVSEQSLKELVADMFETMRHAGGVGLAAIQIGVPLRVFVMEVHKDAYVFINPTVSLSDERVQMNEGCLSLPGIIERCIRSTKATVTSVDENGVESTRAFDGIEAQCIQHEYEHLDGIILPDKIGPMARDRLAAKMKKEKKP